MWNELALNVGGHRDVGTSRAAWKQCLPTRHGCSGSKRKDNNNNKMSVSLPPPLPRPSHPVSAVFFVCLFVLFLVFSFCCCLLCVCGAVHCRTGCLHCLGGIRRMSGATCHSLCYPFQHPVTVAVHRRSRCRWAVTVGVGEAVVTSSCSGNSH